MPKYVLHYVADKVRLQTTNTAFQFCFPPMKARQQRVKVVPLCEQLIHKVIAYTYGVTLISYIVFDLKKSLILVVRIELSGRSQLLVYTYILSYPKILTLIII